MARIDIVEDMASAEAVWRGLEAGNSLATPYQRFDLLNAWQSHVGVQENVKPLIVIGYDGSGQPLLLLPLGQARENGAQVARFLGGKHTTFNMGLWQKDTVAVLNKTDLERILDAIAASGVDVLAFTQQPRSWNGIANPIASLGGQPSPNACPVLHMVPKAPPNSIISGSFRSRIRGKDRKLQTLPGFRYFLASTDDEIKQLLDAFFVIKPQRMAAQNLPNVFAEPGIESFIRQACHARLSDGNRAIAIHALVCDEEMIAMFAGVANDTRFSMMFNTYTMSENARLSPGVILLRNIIDYYASHDYTAFDLGIGSDDYKRQFCKDDEPIFDSFIPLSARGRLTAFGMSSLTHAKRIVKQNPALVQMANRLRSALHL